MEFWNKDEWQSDGGYNYNPTGIYITQRPPGWTFAFPGDLIERHCLALDN